MLNVLKMMNAPTKSDTNANTRSAVRRNPRPLFTSAVCASAAEADVTASKPFGKAPWTRDANCTGVTPGSLAT